MTELLYLNNTYLAEMSAMVQKCNEDEKGQFVVLDRTVFYPQGGGQPSDQGVLMGEGFKCDVVMVRNVDGEIRHYVRDIDTASMQGRPVTGQIDMARRLLNARYHTAAHLLGNVVEALYPALKAIKGHSFPKEAYVEFQGDLLPEATVLQESINQAAREGHKTRVFEIDPISFEQKFYKLPYAIPDNKVFRAMQIDGFPPVPCGGTHLSSTDEIGEITITKVKEKGGIVRVSYELG